MIEKLYGNIPSYGKVKTIYKNGLRWNLLLKEVYGKEVYVPCDFLCHYWSLGIESEAILNK